MSCGLDFNQGFHAADLGYSVLLHPIRYGVVHFSIVLLGRMFYDSHSLHSSNVAPLHAARDFVAHNSVNIYLLENTWKVRECSYYLLWECS